MSSAGKFANSRGKRVGIWAIRLRQSPDYARSVHELGQKWGEQAAGWQLHVYSFTKALDLLTHATWEYPG